MEAAAIPRALGPRRGEAAVLSALVAADGDNWGLVSGSLLTVPACVAATSWSRWAELQPQMRTRQDGFDLGPSFMVQPFTGVCAMRAIVQASDWETVVSGIEGGTVAVPSLRCSIRSAEWTSTVFLAQHGITDTHKVVAGAQRPVTCVVATLETPAMPSTESTWAWELPPHLPRGPDMGQIAPDRQLLWWPRRLLGIDWLAGDDCSPIRRLVVGRTHNDAWIAQLKPDYDTNELVVSVAWNEHTVDPLSCTLVARSEMDGLSLMARAIRISDLPARQHDTQPEPRDVSWRSRTLDVALPRGPGRTNFGVALLGPDGRVLDERPAVPRAEQISISLHINGASEPASVSVIGDRADPPSAAQRDEAVAAAIELEAAAREAAAQRRLSTAGDLKEYLRWRFSCRAGEVLVLDPYLVASDVPRVVAFLGGLARPVRALVRSISDEARAAIDGAPDVDLRCLPRGSSTLHDRVWLVGDTALLVGTSLNRIVRATHKPQPATTVTELPYGDAAIWRQLFEQWWSR